MAWGVTGYTVGYSARPPPAPKAAPPGGARGLPRDAGGEAAGGPQELLLIRHGQCDAAGALTRRGEQQAALAGQRLRALLRDAGPGAGVLWCSDQPHAVATARIVARHARLPPERVRVSPALGAAGVQWPGAGAAPPPPGGGAAGDGEALRVVVAHAHTVQEVVGRALQAAPEAAARVQVPHCSFTRVALGPGAEARVECVGDAGHLPPALTTVATNVFGLA